MQKFDYRSARFSANFQVQVTFKEMVLIGRCRDISREGMLLELPQPLPANVQAIVFLKHREEALELNVRVVHAQAEHSGVRFIYGSDKERSVVEGLVSSLAVSRTRPLSFPRG